MTWPELRKAVVDRAKSLAEVRDDEIAAWMEKAADAFMPPRLPETAAAEEAAVHIAATRLALRARVVADVAPPKGTL